MQKQEIGQQPGKVETMNKIIAKINALTEAIKTCEADANFNNTDTAKHLVTRIENHRRGLIEALEMLGASVEKDLNGIYHIAVK